MDRNVFNSFGSRTYETMVWKSSLVYVDLVFATSVLKCHKPPCHTTPWWCLLLQLWTWSNFQKWFFFMCITFNVCFWLLAITYVLKTQMGHVSHFRHLHSKRFQWYKKLFNVMGFDPCNRSLKIRESIGTPTPKVGVHLGVCGFIPSHFLTFSRAWIWFLGFTLGPHLHKPLSWSWAKG